MPTLARVVLKNAHIGRGGPEECPNWRGTLKKMFPKVPNNIWITMALEGKDWKAYVFGKTIWQTKGFDGNA